MFNNVVSNYGAIILISFLFTRAYCQDVAYPFSHLEDNKVPAFQQQNTRTPLYAPNRCLPNQLLYPGDQQDDWICDCKPGFVYSPIHSNCFAILRQGPCKNGYHLVLKNKEVVPECVKNPCSDGYARYTDGKCYELGRPGEPCPEEIIGGGVFNINASTLIAECVKELNPNIFNYIDKHPNTNFTKGMRSTVRPQTSTNKINTTKKTIIKSWVVVKDHQ